MIPRNLPFAKPEERTELSKEILRRFFTCNSNLTRHRFQSPLPVSERVDSGIFHASFFRESSTVLVCFSQTGGIAVYISYDQDALAAYLLSDETIDYETDIYLFSPDLDWCIAHMDEFYPDNSRMTFIYSTDELI